MTSLVLPDRKRALVLLASHLYDSLAGPKGMRYHAGKGQAAPSHYEPCLACGGSWKRGPVSQRVYGHTKGSGWIVDRFKRRVPCEACGGTLEDGIARKGAGQIGMDRMTGKRVGTEEAPARKSSSWTCNFCFGLGVKAGSRCEPCEGSGRREHSPFVLAGVRDEADDTVDFELPALDRAIDERDRAGDFHRLEVALAELAKRSPHYWRTFHAVHVVKTRELESLDGRERVWLSQAYTRLLLLMPAEIRVPRDLVYAAKNTTANRLRAKGRHAPQDMLGERDMVIRERFARGHGDSARVLAREFGLSVQRVNEIVYQEREIA